MLRLLDPTNNYKGVHPSQLLEACGIVPLWMEQLDDTAPAKDQIEAMYGFGTLNESTGGTVAVDGTYKYPEDPALYPVASWTYVREDKVLEEVFLYEYAILAIRTGGKLFITRVD